MSIWSQAPVRRTKFRQRKPIRSAPHPCSFEAPARGLETGTPGTYVQAASPWAGSNLRCCSKAKIFSKNSSEHNTRDGQALQERVGEGDRCRENGRWSFPIRDAQPGTGSEKLHSLSKPTGPRREKAARPAAPILPEAPGAAHRPDWAGSCSPTSIPRECPQPESATTVRVCHCDCASHTTLLPGPGVSGPGHSLAVPDPCAPPCQWPQGPLKTRVPRRTLPGTI